MLVAWLICISYQTPTISTSAHPRGPRRLDQIRKPSLVGQTGRCSFGLLTVVPTWSSCLLIFQSPRCECLDGVQSCKVNVQLRDGNIAVRRM
jgi:hypothetical protein